MIRTTRAIAMTVRADEVLLNDKVAVPTWNGSVEVRQIQALALVGDDVEMTFEEGGSTSTSAGNDQDVIRRVRG